MDNGKAIDQANAVFSALKEYQLTNVVQACSFDTTAVNTGKIFNLFFEIRSIFTTIIIFIYVVIKFYLILF